MDPNSEADWTRNLLIHAGWVRNLAQRLVADSSIADDVVQQTWLAALTRRPSARYSLRPWLGRVLRAQVALRRRGRIHRHDREASATLSDPLPSAEELALRTEAHERLVRAVRALREPYRSAIVLHFYEGLSAADIARRRGVPSATVRSQIHRGLEQLRTELDGYFGNRNTWCSALAPLLPARRMAAVPYAPRLALAAKIGLASLIAGCLGWWVTGVPLHGRVLRAAQVPAASLATSADDSRPRLTGLPERALPLPQRVPASTRDDDSGRRIRLIDQVTREPLPQFDLVVHRPDGGVLPARTDSVGGFLLNLNCCTCVINNFICRLFGFALSVLFHSDSNFARLLQNRVPFFPGFLQ
jgi:RNA polymerase sigma-70 factor (ECF subfamily)